MEIQRWPLRCWRKVKLFYMDAGGRQRGRSPLTRQATGLPETNMDENSSSKQVITFLFLLISFHCSDPKTISSDKGVALIRILPTRLFLAWPAYCSALEQFILKEGNNYTWIMSKASFSPFVFESKRPVKPVIFFVLAAEELMKNYVRTNSRTPCCVINNSSRLRVKWQHTPCNNNAIRTHYISDKGKIHPHPLCHSPMPLGSQWRLIYSNLPTTHFYSIK